MTLRAEPPSDGGGRDGRGIALVWLSPATGAVEPVPNVLAAELADGTVYLPLTDGQALLLNLGERG